MNKNHDYRKPLTVEESRKPELEPEMLEEESGNLYRIVGIVGDQYIVKTDEDLKRVKIKPSDNKRIGDQIKIEKL